MTSLELLHVGQLPRHANPVPGEALDIIFIEGLVADTVIGIHDDELEVTQPVRIDLQAGLPRSHACATDRIHDTIDYSVVRGRVLRLLAEHGVQLLEALAEDVARILVMEFGAVWTRVAVAKPRKFDDVVAVGVVIERRAGDFALPRGRIKSPDVRPVSA